MESFIFPKLHWIFVVPVILWAFCRIILRRGRMGVTLFVLVAAGSWFVYDAAFNYFMERWMRQQRVFEVLFYNFPDEKSEYVGEYKSGYKSGGQMGLARAQEAMKIRMMTQHIKYYIASTPAKDIAPFVAAEAELLNELNNKNPHACYRYINDSAHYNEAWQLAGSSLFLAPLRYVPQMITDAADHPEPLTQSDRARALELFSNIWGGLQTLGVDINTMVIYKKQLTCNVYAEEFQRLAHMDPKDAALVVKVLFSADHLGNNSVQAVVPETLVPFH